MRGHSGIEISVHQHSGDTAAGGGTEISDRQHSGNTVTGRTDISFYEYFHSGDTEEGH
jgi:hypothetical protein